MKKCKICQTELSHPDITICGECISEKITMKIKKEKELKANKYITQICNVLKRENITYELEYKFLKDRKFRFDLAFPLYKVAVEYEGIFADRSRHTNLAGYTKDCEKYNLATIDSWRVLRYTAVHFANNKVYDVIEQIKDLLNQQYLKEN